MTDCKIHVAFGILLSYLIIVASKFALNKSKHLKMLFRICPNMENIFQSQLVKVERHKIQHSSWKNSKLRRFMDYFISTNSQVSRANWFTANSRYGYNGKLKMLTIENWRGWCWQDSKLRSFCVLLVLTSLIQAKAKMPQTESTCNLMLATAS